MKRPHNFLLCTHNQTFIKKNFESYLASKYFHNKISSSKEYKFFIL